MATPRSVFRVADGVRAIEGAGLAVRRPFPTRALEAVDPFRLLDEMDPADWVPRRPRGRRTICTAGSRR